MQVTASWLITEKEKLEACTQTGISFLHKRSKLSMQKRFHLITGNSGFFVYAQNTCWGFQIEINLVRVLPILWEHSWSTWDRGMCSVHLELPNTLSCFIFLYWRESPYVFGSSFYRNYILLSLVLQPADWDDREYIDDPNAVKPEVLYFIRL